MCGPNREIHMKTIALVGEANPYSSDPGYALYPEPQGATGDRLCRIIMGLTHHQYLRRFDRFDLCTRRWSTPRAREQARIIVSQGYAKIVLLGARVRGAFRVIESEAAIPDFFTVSGRYVLLPHPSGRNRIWQEPGSIERARRFLVEAGVLTAEDQRKEPQ